MGLGRSFERKVVDRRPLQRAGPQRLKDRRGAAVAFFGCYQVLLVDYGIATLTWSQ